MARDPFEIKQDTVTEMQAFFSDDSWNEFLTAGLKMFDREYPVLADYIRQTATGGDISTNAAVIRGIMAVIALIKFQSDKSAANTRMHMGALSPFDDDTNQNS